MRIRKTITRAEWSKRERAAKAAAEEAAKPVIPPPTANDVAIYNRIRTKQDWAMGSSFALTVVLWLIVLYFIFFAQYTALNTVIIAFGLPIVFISGMGYTTLAKQIEVERHNMRFRTPATHEAWKATTKGRRSND